MERCLPQVEDWLMHPSTGGKKTSSKKISKSGLLMNSFEVNPKLGLFMMIKTQTKAKYDL